MTQPLYNLYYEYYEHISGLYHQVGRLSGGVLPVLQTADEPRNVSPLQPLCASGPAGTGGGAAAGKNQSGAAGCRYGLPDCRAGGGFDKCRSCRTRNRRGSRSAGTGYRCGSAGLHGGHLIFCYTECLGVQKNQGHHPQGEKGEADGLSAGVHDESGSLRYRGGAGTVQLDESYRDFAPRLAGKRHRDSAARTGTRT